ncbi:MAG: B12-binding domain-containing radical SAM protein [Candidatus Eremiobacteraeota bacterium]|nr:B12-binding domain-containing radical SAM protein [Candidatus Eremiobacteraeota bacterium]
MDFTDRQVLLIAPEIINLRSMPCVGLGYIGAYLKQQGRNVRIVDAQFTKEDPLPVLAAAEPTLVAIGVDSRTIFRGLRIARWAKRFGHVTLLGGLHVSLIKEQILDWDEVDYGIVGDGEISTNQLLEALEGRRALSEVSGLVYRQPDGTRARNLNKTEELPLDDLPFPDYRLAGIDHFPLYPLVTSRDCPYKCTYCTVGNISHGRFRSRSAESCVRELLLAKERYNVRGFLVVDENFAVIKGRAYEFLELLNKYRVGLPWTSFEGIRADALNDDFLTLLKASDCRWINFGIESAENAVLKTVLKGSKFETVERAVRKSREYKFKVGGFLIVGLPESSFEHDMRTVDWVTKHLDRAQFWMSIPYYGTKLHEWVKQNARLLRPPVGDNLVNSLSTMPYYDTPNYPARQVKRAHVVASFRTGLSYFFEQMDKEALNAPRERHRRDVYQRRLVQFAVRWDPSWLPNITRGRRLPDAIDPVHAAMHAGQQDEPLPRDLQSPYSTPVGAAAS